MSGNVSDALELYERARKFSIEDKLLQRSLDVLDAALRLYTPDRIAVAFNGGKDATVVLHLTRAAIANWHRTQQDVCKGRHKEAISQDVNCLYLTPIDSREEFTEVEEFVRGQVRLHGLCARECVGDFKKGVEKYICEKKLSAASCAFVMGTRANDPFGDSLEHFTPSSEDWAPFMRVNPILKWDYHAVWRFLRAFNLPYCALYDRGYTSIGSVSTTSPNPALRICNAENDSDCAIKYSPAWMLRDARLERAGRRCRTACDNESPTGVSEL